MAIATYDIIILNKNSLAVKKYKANQKNIKIICMYNLVFIVYEIVVFVIFKWIVDVMYLFGSTCS